MITDARRAGATAAGTETDPRVGATADTRAARRAGADNTPPAAARRAGARAGWTVMEDPPLTDSTTTGHPPAITPLADYPMTSILPPLRRKDPPPPQGPPREGVTSRWMSRTSPPRIMNLMNTRDRSRHRRRRWRAPEGGRDNNDHRLTDPILGRGRAAAPV